VPELQTLDKVLKQAEKWERIKFNVSSLDLLTNGVDVGMVTELFGTSGSGKTQLCLQLALTTQLSRNSGGLDGKVIYISTEKLTPVKRLQQMVKPFKEKFPHINFMDNIYVYEFSEPQGIERFVKNDLYQSLVRERHPVKLLIIDSIAGIYRNEGKYLARSRHMRQHFRLIIKYANKFNFAIVITNHVTSVPKNIARPHAKSGDIAALGRTWSSIITTRLRIAKTRQTLRLTVDKGNAVETCIRKLSVEKSPRRAKSSAYFLVTPKGIESIKI
jgi:RecA/RadA recombinase